MNGFILLNFVKSCSSVLTLNKYKYLAMLQPTLYLAITNHGFGHATRMAAIAAEIQRQYPEVLLIFATTAPRWLLESYISGHFILRPRAFDVGVVQSDSVTMDKTATLEQLKQIQARQAAIVASEANFIRQNRVSLILADIPPLVTLIAKAAGVPCWMVSNFGWDFIYRAWGGEFVEIADWIADCFSQCDRLFRLPLNEPMGAFPNIVDAGFTGGEPRYPAEQLRQTLRVHTPPERTVLMTFGGLGLARIPYECLNQFPDWQFITFDQEPPALPNLIGLRNLRYGDAGVSLRPVDIMPLCGRVIAKPGFSTFSEACRLGTPVISITRDDFPEAAVLLEGIQHYIPHRIVPTEDFFDGNWQFLREPLHPPLEQRPVTDGNQMITEAVINFLQKAYH